MKVTYKENLNFVTSYGIKWFRVNEIYGVLHFVHRNTQRMS
jgi:hypothetical protein